MAKQKSFFSMCDTDGTRYLLLGAGYREADTAAMADILVFNGGTDIATSIYGAKPIPGHFIALDKSPRDEKECEIYAKYQGKKFMLGICRGAQLLNCLNGGTLWQHVNNHNRGLHNMIDIGTGLTFKATSTHHQMMRPNLDAGQLIAIAHQSTEKFADGQFWSSKMDPDEEEEDTEIVWYPKSRSLCIQGHPEYIPGSEFANYCLSLIEEMYVAKAA